MVQLIRIPELTMLMLLWSVGLVETLMLLWCRSKAPGSNK